MRAAIANAIGGIDRESIPFEEATHKIGNRVDNFSYGLDVTTCLAMLEVIADRMLTSESFVMSLAPDGASDRELVEVFVALARTAAERAVRQ